MFCVELQGSMPSCNPCLYHQGTVAAVVLAVMLMAIIIMTIRGKMVEAPMTKVVSTTVPAGAGVSSGETENMAVSMFMMEREERASKEVKDEHQANRSGAGSVSAMIKAQEEALARASRAEAVFIAKSDEKYHETVPRPTTKYSSAAFLRAFAQEYGDEFSPSAPVVLDPDEALLSVLVPSKNRLPSPAASDHSPLQARTPSPEEAGRLSLEKGATKRRHENGTMEPARTIDGMDEAKTSPTKQPTGLISIEERIRTALDLAAATKEKARATARVYGGGAFSISEAT